RSSSSRPSIENSVSCSGASSRASGLPPHPQATKTVPTIRMMRCIIVPLSAERAAQPRRPAEPQSTPPNQQRGRRWLERGVRRLPSIAILPQKKSPRLGLTEQLPKPLQPTHHLGFHHDAASQSQPAKVAFLHAGANLIPVHFLKGRQDFDPKHV